MPEPAIEAVDVVRSYGERRALDGFSLVVPRGGVFGLLGPNGSGKSTFITLLAAMEAPPQGSIRVLGHGPTPLLRARIGTVFQENAQDPLLTVRETLTLAGRLFDVPRATLATRQADLLERFGLAGRETEPVSALSGGMRRRLEMVRALLHDPELVLLDEPTTGVDVDERRALWAALLARGQEKRTILLATNDLAEADAVCDEVAFVSAGRVMATGTPNELKRGLRREAVRVTWPGVTEEDLAAIASWRGTGDVTRQDGLLHVTVDDATTFVPRLFEHAPGAIRGVSIEQSTLEDAYVQFVGHRTRVAEPVP